MYNHEIKERFLGELDISGRNTKSCFAIMESLGAYEQLVEKDLAVMNLAEVTEALRYTNARTYGSAFAVISIVRRYMKWCSENRVFDVVNEDVVSITVDDVDISVDLKKQVFLDEAEFIEALRQVRPFDDGYYDVIAMVFFWIGISQKQMMDLRLNDVDFSNQTVNVDGNLIQIPDNLCKILEIYSKTKTGTRLARSGPRTVYRDDSYDLFMRKFSPPSQLGKKLTKSQVEDAIYNLNKAYVELGNEPRFTSGNVISSGALYRVRKLELSGVDVFSIKHKTLVIETFRTGAKLHEILWLYKNYKKAFSL